MVGGIHVYKERLEQTLADLTKELESIGVRNPDNESDWVPTTKDMNDPSADQNDVADRTEEWDERQATVAVLETRFNNLRRALKRIEDETFGVCEVCEKQIEHERLEANLAARTCKAHLNEEMGLPG